MSDRKQLTASAVKRILKARSEHSKVRKGDTVTLAVDPNVRGTCVRSQGDTKYISWENDSKPVRIHHIAGLRKVFKDGRIVNAR